MKVLTGNYDNNPFDLKWPMLLQDYELEIKAPKKYNYALKEILWQWKDLVRMS